MKIQIKNLIKNYGTIENYLFSRNYKTRYVGFSIDIPFTTESTDFIRFKKNDEHPTFTFIDTTKNQIINYYFYKWLYDDINLVDFLIQFHNELLKFCNWYCKVICNIDKYPNFRNFYHYQFKEQLLAYYGLYQTFTTIFNHDKFFKVTKQNYKDFKSPKLLKDLILSFDSYKKLFESNMV